MAFGPLIDTTITNHSGVNCRVLLERDGYTGTIYSPPIQSWTVKHGNDNDTLQQVRKSLFGTTRLQVEKTANTTTILQELQKISGQSPRNHRITFERGGNTIFFGWAKPDATSTPRNVQRPGVVTLQGKDQLGGLSADWKQSDGSVFSGNLILSVAIADILNRLGLALPLRVVDHWRPSTMAQSDDPLSMQVPADAFYRTGGDGVVRSMGAGEVLDDLLEKSNLQIIQVDGVWQILQPGAFTTAQTDVNDEVTVWRYDSAGTLLATTTEKRAAAVDVNGEGWSEGSGEAGGNEVLVDSRVTYEHGAPDSVAFEGSFETITNWTFNNATHGGILDRTDANAYIVDGSWGLQIEGQEYDPATQNKRDLSNDYAEHSLGILTPAAEPIDLKLWDKARTDQGQANHNDSHQFFSVRQEVDGSTTTYWWDEPAQEWAVNPSVDRRIEIDAANPIPMDAFRESVYRIPAPPASGPVYLRLWNPTYVEGGTPITQFFGAFDALVFSRSANAPAKTVYRVHDPTVEEGGEINRTVRVGEGPWKGSKGALLDNAGNQAFNFSLSTSSVTYPLSVLAARRMLALRSSPQKTDRARLQRPTNVPKPDRAIDFGGARYWPLLIREEQPEDIYEVRAVQLLDSVPASAETQILPGGGEDISDDPSETTATSGGGGGDSASTWTELTGKPFNALDDVTVGADGSDRLVMKAMEISSFYPGLVAGGAIMFRHMFNNQLHVVDLTVHVETAPSKTNGVDFDVVRINTNDTETVLLTFTLVQGAERATVTIGSTFDPGEGLKLVEASGVRADALADCTFSFSLASPV